MLWTIYFYPVECVLSEFTNGFLTLDNGNSREQIWVYGNSFESYLVAVAVPNQQVLEDWAKSNGEEGDFTTLCKRPRAQEFILSELTAMGKKKGVRNFLWNRYNFENMWGIYFDLFGLLQHEVAVYSSIYSSCRTSSHKLHEVHFDYFCDNNIKMIGCAGLKLVLANLGMVVSSWGLLIYSYE